MTSGVDSGPGWGRLHSRLVLVNLSVLAAPVAMLLISRVAVGGRVPPQVLISLASLFATFLVICGISLMRYFTTRYRVTDERVVLRSGLLFRSHRSIPIDRIRGIDLTANPMHRIFGLTTLRIDTGEQSSAAGRLSLDGIRTADAVALRRRLVERRAAATGSGAAPEPDGLLGELDWAWLRYAPLTVWGVGSVFAAVGTVARILGEMKVDPREFGIVRDVIDRFGAVPLWFGVLVTAVIIVVLGVVSSTASYIESWSGYQLRRADDRFQIRRGLVATRSVSIQRQRLRGVELVEPIPLRWAGGARLNAVASGLGNVDANRRRSVLTPPAPRAEALRVATAVLARDSAVLARAGLAAHPRAALWRRVNRGLTVVALVAAVLVGLGLWLSPVLVRAGVVVALVLAPVAVLLAFDAYRRLGHGTRDGYLVISAGTFTHRTVALEEGAIIGWNISRSFLQRRRGLLTLGASTAAGSSVYKIRDAGVTQGLALAEAAVPSLLTPFIEPVS